MRRLQFGHPLALVLAGLAGVACLLGGSVARSQDVRPGDERLPLPELESESGAYRPEPVLPHVPSFEPPTAERGGALPPLILPDDRGGALQAGERVLVREVRIRGNTLLADPALGAIAKPYEGRELDYADVLALRDELTLAYVRAGYVTSGAVVPAQDWADGVLEIEIVEGRLTGIEIETDGRLRPSYLERRIDPGSDAPLDVDELRDRLQVLQQDDRIRSVRAELLPTARQGEAVLRVAVAEARPWRAELGASNYLNPALGDAQGEVLLAHGNVTGFGDVASVEYEGSEGMHDLRPEYFVPFTRWDTRLGLAMRRTWGRIVEDPFDELDIESETQTYGISLHQPLHHSPSSRLEAFARGEYRRGESFLFGDRFSFVVGPDEGVSELAVMRGGLEWIYRSSEQVWAARGQISGGLDALGATRHRGTTTPDGQFVAGLVQLQWARRLPLWKLSLIARGDVQLADRPLLGLEQFSIGGRDSVRGYRENEVVRDSGAVGSVELRVPIPVPNLGRWPVAFELAPFFDAGYGWNESRGAFPKGENETLLSAGIGARMAVASHLAFEVYWGGAIEDTDPIGETSLQDRGVHLGLRCVY